MSYIEFNIPLGFWTKEIIYRIDITDYFKEEDLSSFKDSNLFITNVYNKFKYQKGVIFENKDLWYLIKFYFISSNFFKLSQADFYGGVPSNLKILCDCGNLLEAEFNLKGYFNISKSFIHEYYLRISKTCSDCHKTICIYRNKVGVLSSLMIFLNFLDPTRNYQIYDDDIFFGWLDIMHNGFEKQFDVKLDLFIKDLEAFARLIPLDNPKFLRRVNEFAIKK